MYQVTFRWYEGSGIVSRTISSEQSTKIPNAIRLGRDPLLCDVVIQDKINRLSRLHAELFFDADLRTFFVRNLTWNQAHPNVVLADDKLVVEDRTPVYSGSTITLRDIPVQLTIAQINASELNNPDPTVRVQTPSNQQTVPVYPQNPGNQATVPVSPQNPGNQQTVPVYPQNPGNQATVPVSPQNPGNQATAPAYPQNPGYQATVPVSPQNPGYGANNPVYPQNPVYQQPTPVPNYQTPAVSPNPGAATTGDLKIESSIIQRAVRDDEQAIATMFRQFIPDDEQIHCARYLGIQGLWGFGTHQFGCVSDRRVADITIGYFGELTYQDGFLEHINSGVVRQPSKLALYFLVGVLIVIFPFSIFPFIGQLLRVILGDSGLFSGLSFWVALIISYAITIALIPWAVRLYYRFNKCGLVLSVREGELFLTPVGTYAFSHRLIYLFSNRRFINRANALYRSFILSREQRLYQVEQYSERSRHQQSPSPQLTHL